jgi:outer membrane immunogenic protein
MAAATTANAAPTNWSGIYIGINGGYVGSESDGQNTVSCAPGCGYWLVGDAAAVDSEGWFELDDDSWTLGGTLGWNFQSGNIVFGAEGDFNWLSASDSNTTDIRYTLAPANGNYWTNSFDTDWMATARARLGLAAGPVLIYATGGAAFTDVTFASSADEHVGGVPDCGATLDCGSSVYSGTRTGWTVGGGMEIDMGGGWSFKGEMLYADFGSFGSTSVYDGPFVPGAGDELSHAADLTRVVGRAGLNLRF